MPLYEVEHVCPLTVSQQDDLAAAITRIHAEKFTTPKLFVNVRFTNVSEQVLYVAGKRRNTNRIIASVRPGASRSQADYADLCRQIEEAWAEVVPLPQVKRSMPVPDTELRAVFVLGSITAGTEAGFALPQAGQDVSWLEENMTAFQAKADAGDAEFRDLVEEVRTRGLIKGVDGR
ncbi:hypothetical protein LTR66_004647 [Elasticomyces elasticus]|nr:hypothetical protein LTR66_004647 [Elasticomyces elasticus]